LSWPQVAAWRARRHFLDRRRPRAEMLEVVSGIAGLHAQLMSSAELTLWARVEGLAAGDVERALWKARSLVKTWAMRGTLHLIVAAEYRLWLAALGTFRHFLKPAWLRAFRLSRAELERMVDAIAAALDGHALTREELARDVSRRTGSARLGARVRGSWGSCLKPAAYRGQLCFAPGTGTNVRFTGPARWLQLSRAAPIDSERAHLALTRRFLAAYGPATREDYARWWGLTAARAGALIAALGAEVAPVEVEGARAWMLARDVDGAAGAEPPRSVRLLPAFDPYVIGASRHARALMPGDFRGRVYRAQGWISPVLLVDGRMGGVWRHERKGRRLVVQLEPFVKLPAWVRSGAEDEATRLAAFTDGKLELAWKEPSPHSRGART
jgi:hypothetical protein